MRGSGIACFGLLAGCLVDADAPCGDDFDVTAEDVCVCPLGTVPLDGRCEPCGEHEVAVRGACECDDGYERASAGAICAVTDTGSIPLGGNCSTSRECAGAALCDVYGTGVCSPPPAGYGAACTSASDCAGTGATYCETFSSRTCQIEGCAESRGECPGDLACCDFGVLGTSLCIPPDELSAGECPAPGTLVPREGTP